MDSRSFLGRKLLAGMDQLVDLTLPQQCACFFQPGMIIFCIQAKSGFGDGREIFTGMVPVDDLNRMGKVSFDQFPDPDGPITNKDQFFIQIGLALAGLAQNRSLNSSPVLKSQE